jgi:hypothetical protein
MPANTTAAAAAAAAAALTGVNIRAALFGSCTSVGQPASTCLVTVGRDLVGDAYDGTSGSPIRPDDDPVRGWVSLV